MMTAVVTDASAAYLQRQGLDTLADGAALTAADSGASGEQAYGNGLDADLHLDADVARAAAFTYLHRVGAYSRYPGLTAQVFGRLVNAACHRRGARPDPFAVARPGLTCARRHRRHERGDGR